MICKGFLKLIKHMLNLKSGKKNEVDYVYLKKILKYSNDI